MVVTAEQNPVSEVGAAACCPRIDVVRFGPGWRPVTAGPAASAIACRQRDSLCTGEQSTSAPDVKNFALTTEHDRENACVARDAPCRRGADGHGGRLKERDAAAGSQLIGRFELTAKVCIGDGDPYGGTGHTEHTAGIRFSCDADHLDDGVECELFHGAYVRLGGASPEPVCTRAVGRVGEPWPSPARCRNGIHSGDDDRSRFRVEEPGQPAHAVDLRTDPEESSRPEAVFSFGDPRPVEHVSRSTGHAGYRIGMGSPRLPCQSTDHEAEF